MPLSPSDIYGMLRHTIRGRATGKPYGSGDTVTLTASNVHDIYKRGVDPPHPSSRNHGPVVAVTLGWLAHHGTKLLLSLQEWLSWYLDKWIALQRRVGWEQNEINAGVYDRWMRGPTRWMRALAILGGRDDVRAACDSWLRFWAFVNILPALRGPGANLTSEQVSALKREGPVLLVASGNRSRWANDAICSHRVGERAFSRPYATMAFDSLNADDLAQSIGLDPNALSEEEKALRAQFPGRSELWAWPLDDADRAALVAVLDTGSAEAVAEAARRFSDGWTLEKDLEFALYGDFERVTWFPKTGGGSTASTQATRSERVPGGVNRLSLISANNGDRGTGAEDQDLQPAETTLEQDGTKLWTRRTSGIPYPDGKLHSEGVHLTIRNIAEATCRVTIGRQGVIVRDRTGRVLFGPGSSPTPLPTPAPGPVPEPVPAPRPKPSKRKNLNWAVILGALVIFGLLLARGC